jgi:hypothetical protein
MNQVTAGNYLGQRLRRTKGVEPKGSTLCADESSGLCCHHTRAEAEADNEHFNGKTTE